MNSRRAWLGIVYNEVDITADITPHLLSWSYTDNMSGQADDLQITLEDKEQLWSGDWMPEEGATIWARVVRYNWNEEGTDDSTPLGSFEIDEIEVNSPPSVVTIKAVSVPESSSLRGEKKHRAWEKTRLSIVARDIASGAGLGLFYDTDDDPDYDRIEQTGETDLVYLMRLCTDAGLCLKVSDNQVIIFDESQYEAADPVDTIHRTDIRIKNHGGRRTLTGIYHSCRVEYHDSQKNTTIRASFTPPTPPNTERILFVNEHVDSIAKAQILARKRLRETNKHAVTYSMTLMGEPGYAAGQTLNLSGFGWFDGKYIISQITNGQQSGYETRLQMRKCLEGY